MSYTYLAAPYTHDDPEVMLARLEQMRDVTDIWITRGITVFAPVVYFDPIAKRVGAAENYEAWQQHCQTMVAACARFVVLKLDGWEASVGVEDEATLAQSLDIPCLMMTLEEAIEYGT